MLVRRLKNGVFEEYNDSNCQAAIKLLHDVAEGRADVIMAELVSTLFYALNL